MGTIYKNGVKYGGGGSSGGGGTVDPELNKDSSNAVENKAIVAGLDTKQDKLDNATVVEKFSEDTEGHLLYDGHQIEGSITIDTTISETGKNPVEGAAIFNALKAKQDSLDNAVVVDKLSESSDGKLLYDGNPISGAVTIDSEISETSENPVQNKVIDAALKGKQDELDNADVLGKFSESSEGKPLYDGNPFSGTVTVDTEINSTSENPVQNKVIDSALKDKQDKLDNETVVGKLSEDSDGNLLYDGKNIGSEITVDDALSDTSENPVQNKVISEAVDELGENRTVITESGTDINFTSYDSGTSADETLAETVSNVKTATDQNTSKIVDIESNRTAVSETGTDINLTSYGEGTSGDAAFGVALSRLTDRMLENELAVDELNKSLKVSNVSSTTVTFQPEKNRTVLVIALSDTKETVLAIGTTDENGNLTGLVPITKTLTNDIEFINNDNGTCTLNYGAVLSWMVFC